MAAQQRVYRRRIRSVQSTKKITKAMELIAASRIAKAQQRVEAAKPYADEITRVLSALASNTTLDDPLLTERERPRRAAIVVVTSDRGLAGGYSANALRTAEELIALVRSEGKEPVLYVVGRKGVGYYRFRSRPFADSWSGFSEQPKYSDARNITEALVSAFTAGTNGSDSADGVDEVHLVYTEFRSMITQQPVAKRIAPLVVEDAPEPAPAGYLPEYEFEPDAPTLLTAMLPKYLNTRIFSALLESAASESAARRKAMKSASDNAEDLIRNLTRLANQARQAEITQEISEIVGGADALAAAGSSD